MSLDVYLEVEEIQPEAEPKIYIRRNGSAEEITRAEWDKLYPGREPVMLETVQSNEVFWANITHNLNTMADAAGIYQELWRPDELGITKARQLIDPLRAGLERLKAEPAKFRAFNPRNGWGTYEGLLEFVERYLAACEQYPDADVRVSR